jgi:hypothetical protein
MSICLLGGRSDLQSLAAGVVAELTPADEPDCVPPAPDLTDKYAFQQKSPDSDGLTWRVPHVIMLNRLDYWATASEPPRSTRLACHAVAGAHGTRRRRRGAARAGDAANLNGTRGPLRTSWLDVHGLCGWSRCDAQCHGPVARCMSAA